MRKEDMRLFGLMSAWRWCSCARALKWEDNCQAQDDSCIGFYDGLFQVYTLCISLDMCQEVPVSHMLH